MGKSKLRIWAAAACLNLAAWGVFGFYGVTTAAPEQRQQKTITAKPPFQNSVAQRMDMVGELREIKELLRVQNDILRDLVKAEKADSGSN